MSCRWSRTPEQGQQHDDRQRREHAGEDRGDVLDDVLLGLDQPGRDDERHGSINGSDPVARSSKSTPTARTRRTWSPIRTPPPSEQELKIDRELAGEPDEVHAAAVGSPPPPTYATPTTSHRTTGAWIAARIGVGIRVERVDVQHDGQRAANGRAARRHRHGGAAASTRSSRRGTGNRAGDVASEGHRLAQCGKPT